MLPKLRGIIFHSFAETAKRHFSMNSNPIHPRYAHVECSLLHEPPSHIFTYSRYIRGIVSIPSTFISRNPIELLNFRIVSHFDEIKRKHTYIHLRDNVLLMKRSLVQLPFSIEIFVTVRFNYTQNLHNVNNLKIN